MELPKDLDDEVNAVFFGRSKRSLRYALNGKKWFFCRNAGVSPATPQMKVLHHY
ncbi:MAG: hypothetical protein LBC02_10605 [Planctomycetaceae bacterium]|nr:hypothetical protein [Planctomycetaceae bacterium]